MYRQFYNLERNPFEITPDPTFYCPTPLHNEALAGLRYGIEQRKGFVVTTGEVGTGKTLLIQCLMRWLDKSHIAFSHVFNSRLTVVEFLQYISADLGLASANKNKSELLVQLNQFLIDRYRKGSTTVLIVDEGQLLEWDVLEEIRLLTNLETVRQKLLQIILIGQPELEDKLESTNLRQLKQRIAFRCRLEPLTEGELRAYVYRRLGVAGASSHACEYLFPIATLNRIFPYSLGIPRLVNTICDSALITGYARQLLSITPEIIDEVALDARLETSRPISPRKALEPHWERSGTTSSGEPLDRDELLRGLFEMMQLPDIGDNSREPSGSAELAKKEGAGA